MFIPPARYTRRISEIFNLSGIFDLFESCLIWHVSLSIRIRISGTNSIFYSQIVILFPFILLLFSCVQLEEGRSFCDSRTPQLIHGLQRSSGEWGHISGSSSGAWGGSFSTHGIPGRDPSADDCPDQGKPWLEGSVADWNFSLYYIILYINWWYRPYMINNHTAFTIIYTCE